MPQDRVPEIQARVGRGATLPVAALDRTRTTKLDDGTFSTLDNQIDTQTGTVKAKARFANAASSAVPEPVRQRPAAAALGRRRDRRAGDGAAHRADGDFVYVLNDDRTVSVRPVQRGESTSEVIAVTRGLEAGERVVTEGGDRLKDGARVQLASERPAGGVCRGIGRVQRRDAARRARAADPRAASGRGAAASAVRRAAARAGGERADRRRRR